MNLEDLQYEIETAIATCEAEGIDPSTITVNGHYQPGYPLWSALGNVGFHRNRDGEIELALALTDSRNGYSDSAAWDCDTSSTKPEVECDECGCLVDFDRGGCCNDQCSEYYDNVEG